MKQVPEQTREPAQALPEGVARPATDEEVEAAVEEFFARYRRALERLGTC